MNRVEGRISAFPLVILILETVSDKSLRFMGVNLHNNVVEGGGSADGKSEPAGVKEGFEKKLDKMF